jgi:hypothetical protein
VKQLTGKGTTLTLDKAAFAMWFQMLVRCKVLPVKCTDHTKSRTSLRDGKQKHSDRDAATNLEQVTPLMCRGLHGGPRFR